MKKFLLESGIFLIILFILFYLVFLQADGYTDPFYIRFTTKKQNSLILGTSRAAQGIQPAILNKVLGRSDLFNYSFTITSSPYGPAYLNSVKRKLDQNTKDGVFILAVDPWNISSKSKQPNDSTKFTEAKQFLGETSLVNLYPNFQYLLNSYDFPYYKLLLPVQSPLFLHDDGWLEVTIDVDTASVNKRLDTKIAEYRKDNLPFFKFSRVRLDYLIKIIEYLKPHGNVYLVRLPVHPRMMELDKEMMPGFNKKMEKVSKNTNTPYLDMSDLNEQALFTDGNHLYKDSGAEISEVIGKWILGLDPAKFHQNTQVK